MSIKGLVLVLVLGLAACGAGASAPPPTTALASKPAAPELTLDGMTDAMCACRAPACADQVRRDFASIDAGIHGKYAAAHIVALRKYLERCEGTARDGDDLASMHRMKNAMCACKDAACVDKVQRDFTDFMKRMEEKYKGDRRPEESMMMVGEEMAKCMTDAMTTNDGGFGYGGGTGVSGTSSTNTSIANLASPETGVAECDEYLRRFDQYMSCDKIPQQARDASKQGIEQMKQGWAMLKDPNVPAEAKKAAADACRQAVDALRQSADAMGCRIDPSTSTSRPATYESLDHAHTGIAECDRYETTLGKYMSCDKVPQQAKDASMQGLEQQRTAWKKARGRKAKRAAANDCKQSLDALNQSASAMGCTL